MNPGNGNLLHEMTIELIRQTLIATDGNKSRAARVLGISIRCLREKIYCNERLAEFRGPDFFKMRKFEKAMSGV
jgi:hypothetical protein